MSFAQTNFRAADMPGASKAEPVKEELKKTPAVKATAGGTKTAAAKAPKAEDVEVEAPEAVAPAADSSEGATNE